LPVSFPVQIIYRIVSYDMDTTWEEAEELATDRAEWRFMIS